MLLTHIFALHVVLLYTSYAHSRHETLAVWVTVGLYY